MSIPDFAEKGLYRQYDKAWRFVGYTAEPQYPGQQPTRFPPEWSPFDCFCEGKDRISE